jgi:prepilin-type processing-associated H-X9-DG protein
MGGGPVSGLLKNMNWIAVGATLKPEMSISITIQSPDAASATELAAKLNQIGDNAMKLLRATVAKDPKAAKIAGDLDALGKVLVVKAEGDRVAVKFGPDQTALAGGLIFPAIAKARQSASNQVAASHIRQLLLACQMHAEENRGEFPRDLAAVAKAGNLPGEVMKNPATGQEFAYLRPGRGAAGAGDQVVIYEEPAAGAPTVIVGFADGHVELMSIVDFKERLDASKKRAARQ